MNKKPKIQCEDAFSMAELVIALLILSVTIAGLIRLFVFCSRLAETSLDRTSAMVAVQNKMEEIRNYPFGDIVSDYSSGGTKGNTFAVTSPEGTGTITIDNSIPEILAIQITVSYTDDIGRSSQVTLMSKLAEL